MVQRFNPSIYKNSFIRIMSNMITYLAQNIQSFGFTDFDGFLIICTQNVLKIELHSATLQFRKHQILNHPAVGNKNSQLNYVDAVVYHSAVSKLNSSCNEIYEKHITHLWEIDSLR
jgi:hypothetical protein